MPRLTAVDWTRVGLEALAFALGLLIVLFAMYGFAGLQPEEAGPKP